MRTYNFWMTLMLVAVTFVSGCQSDGPVAPQDDKGIVARFTHSAPEGYMLGKTVLFDASTSSSQFFKITEYTWDWGDGSELETSDVPTIGHIFTSVSEFSVKLTVKDYGGRTAVTAAVLNITPTGSAPIVRFTYNAPDGWQPGAELFFDASATSDPDGDAHRFTWDWGDGEVSEPLDTPTASHVFNVEGETEIRLTVTDEPGWEVESEPLNLSFGYPDGAKIISNRKFGWDHGAMRCSDVKLIGDYLYVALWNGGIRIFDVTDPANPEMIVYDYSIQVGSINPEGNDSFYTNMGAIYSLQDPLKPEFISQINLDYLDMGDVLVKRGNIAYVSRITLTYDHLEIYDISNPSSPVEIKRFPFTSSVSQLSIQGNTLVANSGEDIRLYDLAIPEDPIQYFRFLETGDIYASARFVNGLFYIVVKQASDEQVYLRSYDLSDPEDFREVGSVELLGTGEIIDLGEVIGVRSDLLQLIDITNPNQPVRLTTGTTIYEIEAVQDLGSYAAIAEGYGGLSIMDLRNLQTPHELFDYRDTGQIPVGWFSDIILKNYFGYLTTNDAKLQVLDLKDVANPLIMGALDLNEICSNLKSVGSRLFCMGDDTVYTFDISTPGCPIPSSDISSPGILDYAVDSNSLYTVGTNYSSLEIIDITDIENPKPVSSLHDFGIVESIALNGNYVFLGARPIPSTKTYSLVTVDISSLQSPFVVNNLEWNNKAQGIIDLEVAGNTLLMLLGIPHGEMMGMASNIRIYDIANPTTPCILTQVYLDDRIGDLKVFGNYAYFEHEGVSVLDLDDPGNPKISSYLPSTAYTVSFGIESDLALVSNSNGIGESWLTAFRLW